jgi:hypothetical protein
VLLRGVETGVDGAGGGIAGGERVLHGLSFVDAGSFLNCDGINAEAQRTQRGRVKNLWRSVTLRGAGSSSFLL